MKVFIRLTLAAKRFTLSNSIYFNRNLHICAIILVYSFLKNDYINIEKNAFENGGKISPTVFLSVMIFFFKFAKHIFIRLESSSLLHTQGK